MDSEEDIREVVFLSDRVKFKDKLHIDSKIRVTSDFIQLEIPANNIIYKWVIDNIVHITSCWDKSIQSVIVEIYADIDGVYTPDPALTFAVGLPGWNRKLKEIRSLNDNYKSLWKSYIKSEDTDSVPRDTVPGRNGSTFEEDIPSTSMELVYPKGATDAITITQNDFDSLQPETWVNDTIIEFYLKYLRNEIDPDESHRFHFFSSLFFAKMASQVQDPVHEDPLDASKGMEAFQHVKRWTKEVNLFEKELIFMPISYKGYWSLIVICNFGELAKNEVGDVNGRVPCVLHLDSLRNKHAGLKEFIHSYLREEWKSRASEVASEDISKRFDNLKFLYLKQLPQQENGNDCGLFLLHYTQLFLEEFLACSKVMRGSKFLKADWFTPSEASDKRMVIKKLIYDLKEKQKSPLSTSKKPDEPKSEEAVEWMRREFPGSKHKEALETSKQMLPDCEDKNESLLKQVETWSVELYLEKLKNLRDANALLRSRLEDINEQALIQEEKEKAYDLFDKRIHARLMASKSKFNMLLKLGNKSLKCAELEERLVQIEAGAVNE